MSCHDCHLRSRLPEIRKKRLVERWTLCITNVLSAVSTCLPYASDMRRSLFVMIISCYNNHLPQATPYIKKTSVISRQKFVRHISQRLYTILGVCTVHSQRPALVRKASPQEHCDINESSYQCHPSSLLHVLPQRNASWLQRPSKT